MLSCLFLVALWSPAGKELASWLLFLLCFVASPNVGRETDLSPPAKHFTDRSKAVLLLWIFYGFFLSRLIMLMHICLLMPCGHLLGKADLLALVFDVLL